jgi:hypothetical protein
MTNDEQVVIDVLEHHAKTWDATDPQQAQTFRDAIAVLTAPQTSGVLLPEATPPADPLSVDPAVLVHHPVNPDAETPTNG